MSIDQGLEPVGGGDLDPPAGLLRGQELERKRLARELHDDVGQRLALLGVIMSEIARAAADAPPALRDRIRAAQDEVERLSGDLRRISHNLHPTVVAYVGLADAIRQLCREFSRQMQIEVDLVCDDAVRPASEDVAVALYRITQEALSNVVRHSRSTSAAVSLRQDTGVLQLTITDTGVGFDLTRVQPADGLGLTSIRERAAMIGGALEIRSAPSLGTTIALRVPARLPAMVSASAAVTQPAPPIPRRVLKASRSYQKASA